MLMHLSGRPRVSHFEIKWCDPHAELLVARGRSGISPYVSGATLFGAGVSLVLVVGIAQF